MRTELFKNTLSILTQKDLALNAHDYVYNGNYNWDNVISEIDATFKEIYCIFYTKDGHMKISGLNKAYGEVGEGKTIDISIFNPDISLYRNIYDSLLNIECIDVIIKSLKRNARKLNKEVGIDNKCREWFVRTIMDNL